MSEFGSGVVICLAKFSEHLSHIRKYDKLDFTDRLELTMNAASDHFYDLDRDKAPESLCKLADKALEIGHGFTGKTYLQKDFEEIYDLWRRSCEELDDMLGVKGDWGEW